MKVLSEEGKKITLLGNEAICRGAIESGVEFASTYPGTPASEIGDTFYKVAKEAGIYFEYSTNEKVAMEAAAGAALCGARSLVAMKNFGVNVASDFLMPLVHTGVRGAMVIAVADDPSCWSSAQSEQNTRAFSLSGYIPTLEPSDPQECKEFTKLAFEISDKFKIPVLVRETTRVALQSMPVLFGKVFKEKKERKFIKDPHQFSTMPPRVLEMKSELLEKIEKIREISEKSEINQIIQQPTTNNQQPEIGIITSGVSYLYVMEALKELDLNLPVLKLGFFNPLPEKKISLFIKNLKKVLIAEELEPYLEREVKILAKSVNPQLKIYGKSLLPLIGELKPEHLLNAISQISEKHLAFDFKKHLEKFLTLNFAKRRPQFCPGCPYWLVVAAIKKAVDLKEVVFGGEIGCYMLLSSPPHYLQDYLYCMGSSIGVAHGIKKINKNQKLISFVGDASFFHTGIPALINTVYNKSNPLIIILDNGTTAMTGQQPNPGATKSAYAIKIEDVCKAFGIKNLKIIDPINQAEFVEAVRSFLKSNETSVIIARRPCIRLKT